LLREMWTTGGEVSEGTEWAIYCPRQKVNIRFESQHGQAWDGAVSHSNGQHSNDNGNSDRSE
jgi:hypothetical protein